MKKSILIICSAFALNTSAQIITTVVGNGTAGYSGDNIPATSAELNSAWWVAFDATGNLYIGDNDNNRVRMVNTAGIITTIAGNGIAAYSGDGGQATNAGLNTPEGIAFDAAGNLYIADVVNNRIRMVTTAGIISTVAGNGTQSYSGDGGNATAAGLYSPFSVALDAAGNLFIADQWNNRIRMVNTAGIISTVAGNGTAGYTGDGGAATAAELYQPIGVAIDAAGNLFIADVVNNRIRKVNTAGIITTIAGNGAASYGGDGTQATAAYLNGPIGVAFDAAGNLYIGDQYNNRIRMVNTDGIISTIAGNGFGAPSSGGFSGDGGNATAAELYFPAGVALDAAGNLYIADGDNGRIRKVINVGQTTGINQVTSNNEVSVYPNPSNGLFNLSISQFDNEKSNSIEIYNTIGECVHRQTIQPTPNPSKEGTSIAIDVSGLSEGLYLIRLSNSTGVQQQKLIISR